MIAIIDYNMGNLHSVKKAFIRIGVEAEITNSPEKITQAQKLVLPGVGHFNHGMQQLNNLKLIDLLNEQVLNKKKPILGICLGMQLFTGFSAEGKTDGLGWINANTVKFEKEDMNERMKIPHMGWNNLKVRRQSDLLKGVDEESMFYFVHSYYVTNSNPVDVVGETHYGVDFTSSFQKENIYGVQFHPEKSHDSGLSLLKNFVEIS